MADSASGAPTNPLWREPDFLRYWSGQSVSLVGSQVTALALPIAAVVNFHATSDQMGLIGGLRFVPGLLFGLGAGIWLDRARCRPVLTAANLANCVVVASVPLAAMLGLLRIEQLYVVVLLAGFCATAAQVAESAYVVRILDGARLMDANVKLQMSRTTATLIGPSLGGYLVQIVGAPIAILLDACTFLFAGLAIGSSRTSEAPTPAATVRHPLVDLHEGTVHLWRAPIVRSIALVLAIAQFFSYLGGAVLILLFVGQLHVTPAQFGLLFAISGLSSILGVRLVGPVVARWGPGRAMVACVALFGVGVTLRLPAAFVTPVLIFPILTCAWIVYGLGVAAANSLQQTIRQATTPRPLLSRVQAGLLTSVWTAQLVGSLAGGYLGLWLGLRVTLAISCLGILLAMIPACSAALRGLPSDSISV